MADKSTPMMSQYKQIRKQLPPNTILFFRLGDFYEMFFEDAKIASQILGIALTKRNEVPMCGIPFHAAENYLAKIIRAGQKVAICDQVEDPAVSKGIVRREVTGIVTPGTVTEENVLESRRNNYLAGVCFHKKNYGLAWLDLSTGAFWIEEEQNSAAIQDSLARYHPAECIVPEEKMNDPAIQSLIAHSSSILFTPYEDWTFAHDTAVEFLTGHFKVHSLQGFGCQDHTAATSAAGAVLHYVTHTLHRKTGHIHHIQVKNPRDYLVLDESTLYNLDLIRSSSAGKSQGKTSLLQVLDSTQTGMGSRLLREWILRPRTDIKEIQERHNAVDAFAGDRALLSHVRDALKQVKDIERLIARLNGGGGNARDLRAVSQSLAALPDIKKWIAQHPTQRLAQLDQQIDTLHELQQLIDTAIAEEPPITIKEGGIIRKGYHEELDDLHQAATRGRQWIAEFQAEEQKRTGIKTLKVRHNKVFGYYIEISKGQLGQVPERYTRKQTLVNAERFIVPELKEYEQKILGAHDRAVALEYELFTRVREAAIKETATLQQTASALAQLDILAAFAERSITLRYARPRMNTGNRIQIHEGRHPVVEQLADSEPFVPNDISLDHMENQLIIITGPNMAGKSTYIRQVALIVIMAQAGSFVPAKEAEIGVVDRVFTRVGASDDLARGRSTFMVEMQETANILNNATHKSLIVLDEIGRGTSTFDGISIAWAVAEYLHNHKSVKAKTLFATHYHELTDLTRTLPGAKNYNVLVREKGDRIAFLRKIAPGAADKSYGIQVAQLAGLPPAVVQRAKEILSNLEESELNEVGQPKLARHSSRKIKIDTAQLTLFEPFSQTREE